MEQNERFQNRELSWLDFNYRVLSEAKDKNNPLMERLKFLSITASNLDEFFMIRVASLKDQVNAGYTKRDIAGMTAAERAGMEVIAFLGSEMYDNPVCLERVKALGFKHIFYHMKDVADFLFDK